MTTLDLKTSLLDLLHAIEGSGIRLIIGGGFGLYLKMEHEDSNKEFGRYHALDLYSILATTSEGEWRQGLKMRDRYGTDPYVIKAGALVSNYFSNLDSLGILRLKGSPYFRSQFQIDEFISALQELFPGTANTAFHFCMSETLSLSDHFLALICCCYFFIDT